MYRVWVILTGLAMILINQAAFSQMKLGDRPYTVQRAAILDMESNNQGLLMARITDTSLINALTPPDGMVIYFTPTGQLMVRSNSGWKPLFAGPVDTTNIANFYQKVKGLFSAGTGINYNNTTGVISNTGVTSVGSGYGLSGGTVTTTGTLLVDSATLSGYYLRRKDSSVNGGYYPYTTNPKGYLTGNQTITLTGDVTGSGATSIATTLANSGVTAGTYDYLTVNAKGIITGGYNAVTNELSARVSGTAYQASSTTRTYDLDFTVQITAVSALINSADGQVVLETAPTSSGTWTEYTRSQITASGVASTTSSTQQIVALNIPAGWWYRLTFTKNSTGSSASWSYVKGHETLRR